MGFTLNTLLKYGTDRDTIVAEIKSELLLKITNLIETQFYDRTQGSGLNNLENEMISEDQLILLGTQIVTAIADYSATVGDDRKVMMGFYLSRFIFYYLRIYEITLQISILYLRRFLYDNK